jgi:phosphatidylserine/phosphatidylglycerophosphate/cardiolipin synthase-like enzyme
VTGVKAFRGITVVLVTIALLFGGLPAAQAGKGEVPRYGATFNDPSRYGAPQNRIISSLNAMIRQTPRGETIRITQYNLTCGSSVRALMRAHKRGVHIQIVVNDRVLQNDVTQRGLYKNLRRVLGTNVKKKSFFITCNRGCRTGKRSALHTKFVTISKVRTKDGPRRNLVFTASGNITCGWATGRQYNDQFAVVGRTAWYNGFNKIFAELAADKRPAKVFRVVQDGTNTAWFFPRPRAKRANDLMWQTLKSVRCRGAANRPGGRTLVQVKMFTWNGQRGLNLARKLYRLDQRGCRVEVIVGAPGAGVVRELRRPGRNGGVAIWDSRKDRNGDGELDLYTHMKALVIKGNVAGNPRARMAFTGSANWTQNAFTGGDEVVVRYNTAKAWKQYNRHINYVKTRSNRLSNKNLPLEAIRPYNLNPIAE